MNKIDLALLLTMMIIAIGSQIIIVKQDLQIKSLQRENKMAHSYIADKYNAGYRAGKLEGVAELVECDHVTDINVMRMYSNMSKILMENRELDSAPFPCHE